MAFLGWVELDERPALKALVSRYAHYQAHRWMQKAGLFFRGLGGGEEVGVGEICEAVREEFAHVGDDLG